MSGFVSVEPRSAWDARPQATSSATGLKRCSKQTLSLTERERSMGLVRGHSGLKMVTGEVDSGERVRVLDLAKLKKPMVKVQWEGKGFEGSVGVSGAEQRRGWIPSTRVRGRWY